MCPNKFQKVMHFFAKKKFLRNTVGNCEIQKFFEFIMQLAKLWIKVFLEKANADDLTQVTNETLFASLSLISVVIWHRNEVKEMWM